MGLRQEIEREMHEAAGRSDFLLNQHVSASAKPGDDPVRLIQQALEGLSTMIDILKDQVLRLADEIEALK